MYEKVTLITKKEHADLKFKKVKSMKYASEASHIVVVTGEYYSACKSQPIVFVKTEEEIMSCVILGLKNGSNLFVDKKNNWLTTEYCPFFFKRYPFIYVQHMDKLSLGFDAESGCSSTEEGEAIFDEKGEPTKFTKDITELMNRYQSDLTFTRTFSKDLEEYGLLEPLNITVTAGKGKYKFDGFLKVSEEKFNALKEDVKMDLIKKGYYNLIVAHLISLSNFEKLAILTSKQA